LLGGPDKRLVTGGDHRIKLKGGGKNMAGSKKPMTKAQIIGHLADKCELTKKAAAGVLDELAGLAVSETKKVGAFILPGIGKLVLSKRKARIGRNPATGEEIKIPAKTVVKMRIAKACKDAIVPPKK
jgi:DNA-binding protein HU-beta